MKTITRRQFGKSVAAVGATAFAGISLPKIAFGQPQAASLRYPKGFLWGCATASYQIEGGAKDGGRGPSVWDSLQSHAGQDAINGETGDVADDSYHLYKTDVQLLKNLGRADLPHVHLVVAHLSRRQGPAEPRGPRLLQPRHR